jgi:protein involved in polysaccharide export with SLBB domain
MSKTAVWCWLGVLAILVAGCETTPKHAYHVPEGESPTNGVTITNHLDPALLKPSSDQFVLGPGDQIDVELLGNSASHTTVIVGLDGKIYYSLLPGIDVWGMTLSQARSAITNSMSKYIDQYDVGVSLRAVSSKHAWVLGRVNRPGIYPLTGPMTLLEGLTMAGGVAKAPSAFSTQDIGDLRHSFVMRQGQVVPVDFVRLLQEGDMTQNVYLKPDDFVFIPSSLSQEIYVLGAVANPRTVPYADPMTLVSALAGVNGPGTNAYLSHVAIVRGSLSSPQLIEVNYNDILKGKAPNVLLEPGDIVYVPLSPYRFLTDYADLIVKTFAGAWTANMGIRAVEGSAQNVNVAVPISSSPH